MKIVEESAARLRVRHVPWFLFSVFAMFGMVGVGGALFANGLDAIERLLVAALGAGAFWLAWWAAPMIDLVFDRNAAEARFVERRFTGSRARHFSLDDVIRVRQQADHDDGARLVRLALETRVNGVVPLERGFGSSDRNGIEAAINRWLEGRPPPTQQSVVRG